MLTFKRNLRFLLSTFLLVSSIFLFSCTNSSSQKDASSSLPSWYVNPKQNNGEYLYGVAEGFTMEEATKYALVDVASRLMVSISSESEMTRQADQNSFREEMRQKTKQSIEKISFNNYKISRSKKDGEKFYVEVQIERDPFLSEQKDRVSVLKKKIAETDSLSKKSNPIQRRLDLIKINDFCKELELKIRILGGAGYDAALSKNLEMIGLYQVELSNLSSKIDFFIDATSEQKISSLVKNYLNKEGFKITSRQNREDPSQLSIKIKYSDKAAEIYGANISKIQIQFENYSQNKLVASNGIEISGSSSIDANEAKNAAFVNLEEIIKKEGILKILGII